MIIDLKGILLAALAVGVSGCATIAHGTSQQIRFESMPSGATVRATGKTTQSVTTPGALTLSRDSPYDVTFEKPAFLPAHAHIGQSASGAVWGNILLGGIIGIIVDLSDGAAYNLEPETVSTTLVADPAATPRTESPTAPDLAPALPAH